MQLILLTGMGYFTLMPVIDIWPKKDFFFRKPTFILYETKIIDQMQQTRRNRIRVNLPSYEMLMKMGGVTIPEKREKMTDVKPIHDVMNDTEVIAIDEPYTPGPFMQEKDLPFGPPVAPSGLRLTP